ncbi:hypothetical protein KW786_03535 [Candidatus Parcubacteria bacterium]|nr:hypothetical protein [Candidatus Parcubacteria bacterium]
MRREVYVSSSTRNGQLQTFFKKSWTLDDATKPLRVGFKILPAHLTWEHYGRLREGEVKNVGSGSATTERVEQVWIEMDNSTEELRLYLTPTEGWQEVKLASG